MTRDDLGEWGVSLFMLAAGALATWAILHGVASCYADVKQSERDLAEFGPVHCGMVDVTTPTGQHAVEHQCWRSKDGGAE